MNQIDEWRLTSEKRQQQMQNAIIDFCKTYSIPVNFDGDRAFLSDGKGDWVFRYMERPTILTSTVGDSASILVQSPAEAIAYVYKAKCKHDKRDQANMMQQRLKATGSVEKFLSDFTKGRGISKSKILQKLAITESQWHRYCMNDLKDMPAWDFIKVARLFSIDPEILYETTAKNSSTPLDTPHE